MHEREIEKMVSVIEKYNPKKETITKQVYLELREKIMKGDKEAYDKLAYLSFNVCCDALFAEYIDKGKKAQEFQDEVDDLFLFISQMQLSVKQKSSSKYVHNLKEAVFSQLEAKRQNKLEKNIYLNFNWENNTSEIVDPKTVKNWASGVTQDEIEKSVKERYRKERTQEIAVDSLEYTAKELSKKHNISVDYARRIKKQAQKDIKDTFTK